MHKDSAVSFLRQITSGQIRPAFDKYVALNFKHHNLYGKGDRESLIKGMEENDSAFPDKAFEIKHVMEDGDLVVTHSHVVLKPKELELTVAHFLRFEGGKIVEMWDVAQQIPALCPNENGAF